MLGLCVKASRVDLDVSRACWGGWSCGGFLYVAEEEGWVKRKVLGAARDETKAERLEEGDIKWEEVAAATEVGLEEAR